MAENTVMSNEQLAEAAEKIYRKKYQQRIEEQHSGKFVAINLSSEDAFLGFSPEEAVERARSVDPTGTIHVKRIGAELAV
jgi:hypothetical protein